MRRCCLAAVFSLAIALVPAAGAAPAAPAAPMSREVAQKLAQGTFRELLELLALPNDAIYPADIVKNVEFLERAFGRRGFTTRRLDNAWCSATAARRT